MNYRIRIVIYGRNATHNNKYILGIVLAATNKHVLILIAADLGFALDSWIENHYY